MADVRDGKAEEAGGTKTRGSRCVMKEREGDDQEGEKMSATLSAEEAVNQQVALLRLAASPQTSSCNGLGCSSELNLI